MTDRPPEPLRRSAFHHPMPRYLELFKARLTALVLFSCAAGFLIGSGTPWDATRLLWTLLGTGLTAAGANALNQWLEIDADARMERTRHRPLPAGRMGPGHALLVALLATAAGLGALALLVNLLTAALAAVVVVLYAFAYTPLKKRTPLCTLIGAVCGAIPPMMGWTGATGSLGLGGWLLGAALFFWQIPHSLSLAWLYRADYARGGFRMLPSVDPSGRMTGALAVLYSLGLLPLGLACLVTGMAGWMLLVGSIVLGAGLLLLSVRLQREHSDLRARQLFLGSILYLPLILVLLVADRGPARGFERKFAVGVGPVHLKALPRDPRLESPGP